MGFLAWLESTAIATWVHESPSVWAQATILTMHTTGMAVLVGACWVLDLRLLGIGRKMPLSAFRWVFPAVMFGLVVNLVTGVLLFAARASMWGTALPFLAKMVLVVVGAATLLPIRAFVLRTDADVSTAADAATGGNARLLAIVSILAWTAAITAGRLLAYLVPG